MKKKQKAHIKLKSLLLKESLLSEDNDDLDDDGKGERAFTKPYSKTVFGHATVYAKSMKEAEEKFDNNDCEYDDVSDDENFEWDGGVEDSEDSEE
jgi:hypothetical protein